MNGRTITLWFIFAAVVVAIAFDVWIGITYGSRDTISWVTWTAAHQYPILPFACGVLCGHLFWTQQPEAK